MDYIYPRYLVSNVGVGILPTYTPEMYVIIFAVIIGLYLLIDRKDQQVHAGRSAEEQRINDG